MKKVKHIIHKHKKFIKHSFVGGFSSIITIITYFLLIYIGVNHLVANIISYSFSSVISFYIHLRWVFKTSSKRYFNMFNKYIIATIIGLIFSEFLLYLLANILFVDIYISGLILLPFITIESYLLYNYWVFGD